jgi:PD-(D/E)XK nuclease family transposase
VDVKANDQSGRIFQIEVQLAYYTDLPARMLYTWSKAVTILLRYSPIIPFG